MRQATTYPAEIKARILSKVLAPNAPSIVELAKEFNIPYQTLYAWKCAMLNKNMINTLVNLNALKINQHMINFRR